MTGWQRVRSALFRASRGAGIAAIVGVLAYSNPRVDGPLLFVESLVNGLVWALVAFVIILTYRLIRPPRRA